MYFICYIGMDLWRPCERGNVPSKKLFNITHTGIVGSELYQQMALISILKRECFKQEVQYYTHRYSYLALVSLKRARAQ